MLQINKDGPVSMIQPFDIDLSPPTQSQISGNPFVFALRYVAVVPSIIYMETTENFCVQINNLNEILNLTLLLDSEVLNQVTVKEKDVFQCIPFQVVAFTILELTGNGLTQSFENRKRVRIEKPKHLVFIQADKTIYRAGQEVKFRIISMDKDLHPMKEEVNLCDPKNNRVFQWSDVETPLGIIERSYSLSSNPRLGTYKVVVENDSEKVADYSFEVDEYGKKGRSNLPFFSFFPQPSFLSSLSPSLPSSSILFSFFPSFLFFWTVQIILS
uniref:Macroglobulin domain-containing protein n=1 Tax=Pseudonaja textilis TaxID=8673 RepID=A0A670ZKS9_PSETE